MIRPPAARVALISAAAFSRTSPHSACMRWVVTSSTVTGRNVPAPTCSVTKVKSIPASVRAATSASSKWRLAVGAATAPARLAQIVW
jgi:hypothetical protein